VVVYDARVASRQRVDQESMDWTSSEWLNSDAVAPCLSVAIPPEVCITNFDSD
jgi:hypothetical protein